MTSPVRILVVDDDPACLKALERAFRRPDRAVAAASSAPEALERLAAEAFDLVVLDFALGRPMNGDEVLRRLRARPETRELPVIILMGEASDNDLLRCLDWGASECFTKPVSMALLRRKVDELLKTRRAAAPQPREPAKGEVLLVEDGCEDRRARLWLESAGYAVRSVLMGEAAFPRALEERLPECVVLELCSALEEGLAACDALKRLPRTQAVPVVVCGALAGARPAAYAHGCACVVEMGPEAEVELTQAVGAVIAQQRRALGIVDLGDVRVHSPESAVYHRGVKLATLDHGPFAIFLCLVMKSPAPVADVELRRVAAVRPAYRRRRGAEVPPRTLPTYIYNLRQQLGRELGERIRHVAGAGYAYIEPGGGGMKSV